MKAKNCVPLLYYDWLRKKSRTTFLTNQEWKQKTNHDLLIFISHVWRPIHVLASRRDWFIWLSTLIVIGQNKTKRVSLTHYFPALGSHNICLEKWLLYLVVSSCFDWPRVKSRCCLEPQLKSLYSCHLHIVQSRHLHFISHQHDFCSKHTMNTLGYIKHSDGNWWRNIQPKYHVFPFFQVKRWYALPKSRRRNLSWRKTTKPELIVWKNHGK